jgi:hypothetical protein
MDTQDRYVQLWNRAPRSSYGTQNHHYQLQGWPSWPVPIQNLTSETYESIFTHLVGLLGQGIGPSQGHYLHRTAQHRKMQTHIHALSGIQTHDPSVWEVNDQICLRPRGHIWSVPSLLHMRLWNQYLTLYWLHHLCFSSCWKDGNSYIQCPSTFFILKFKFVHFLRVTQNTNQMYTSTNL